MSKFKIGERVIALTDPLHPKSQPRVKGQLYTVLDVNYCFKCGVQAINITTISTPNPYYYCECGQDSIPNRNKYWTLSRFFAKPEELSDELDKCLEEENYEQACIIRDLLVISVPGIELKELVKKS
jgi:hypothetical protein